MDLFQSFVQNDRQRHLIEKAAKLADVAKTRRDQADEMADFSTDTLQEFKKEQYFSLSLPTSLGGEGLSVYELLLLQERLAVGDGATALSVGWHMGVVMELGEKNDWDPDVFSSFAKEIKEKQKVVNRAASERATGSPTRGGRPETTATKQADGSYLVTGRKTFTTMASVLDFYLVSTYVEEIEAVGWFLIEKDVEGLSVEKTWDTLGMRGTGSHDLVMENVHVPRKHFVEVAGSSRPIPKGWLLHIPACYLGIAIAARNDAIEFAKNFQPNSLNTPISEVAHVQQKIGEMDLKLLAARHFMYAVADKWDKNPELRAKMGSELAAVKITATNAASEVVDLAMKIVGGRGLSKEMPFEKYYRDIRAGLHNPPMEDMVILQLAKQALSEN
ncbi:acyl-CoA/acyl-ACP dehydrogenase [Radiobacillus kanasensis]|uniref:acyl-CoA dehydrogenase family protein n=1 Tax=Radiobacillus kanasensis TaxID=2844358 RepID=UPI001E43E2AE|nr:acyl-CoA dehydrogenase family protein [Radiobacillus kanasensis]UFT98274.1 acyl-CoA/acyl-ACP dehydrogenase [Radiobacillus kanasensis]